MNNNMTAKISLFARDYHYRHNTERIFSDDMAGVLLTDEERQMISASMISGISYFAPDFSGTDDEALRCIVDRQLSPSVLVRSAFCEDALKTAVKFRCRQYVIFACGYDSFSLRNPYCDLKIFELDRHEMIEDKLRRISEKGSVADSNTSYISCDLSDNVWKEKLIQSGFDIKACAFGSLLGISYYLTKEDFRKMIKHISEIWCEGSAVCFDYPTLDEGMESRKNRELAESANEQMKARYTYNDMESLLSDCGFLIYEHHDFKSITERFCKAYNNANPNHIITAPKGVNYCLAVKK